MKTELLTIPAPRPAEIGGGRHARLPRGLPPAGRVAADCTHHRDVCGHLLRCQSWYATPIAAFATTSLRQLTLRSPSSVTLLQARSSLRTRSTSSRTRSSCSTRTCLTRRTAHACRSRTTAAIFAASTLAPTFRTPSSCVHFTLVPRGRVVLLSLTFDFLATAPARDLRLDQEARNHHARGAHRPARLRLCLEGAPCSGTEGWCGLLPAREFSDLPPTNQRRLPLYPL